MKNVIKYIAFILILTISFSCESDEETDKEKPQVDISFEGSFPVNCDTIYFGEPFVLKVRFTDNVELGSFSIDIHNNFDHHSHSTEVTECTLGPVKTPDNPYVLIQDNKILEGLSEYTTNLSIQVPAQNSEGKFDEGDYHFFLSLTDKEGWSAQIGLSLKMLYRE